MPRERLAVPIPWSGPARRRTWRRYVREARRPLICLLFLLPGVLIYEVAVRRLPGGSPGLHDLMAHSMLHNVLAWFGITGIWVPGVVLTATLLIWHARRGQRLNVRWWVLPAMLLESAVLAVPLLVISALIPPPDSPLVASLGTRLTLALGAGIYEELVFRLFLIHALMWLLGDIAQVRGTAQMIVAAGLAALVFAACHYPPLGAEAFEWKSFWFRATGGAYLGAVFLGRGVGLSAGAHVLYNVTLVLMRGAG
jgi:hypothetical protein